MVNSNGLSTEPWCNLHFKFITSLSLDFNRCCYILIHCLDDLKILKALNGTTWGKQKPTLIETYKATVRPIIEYGSTIWSPIIKETNLNKLQVTQNAALRIATGCTSDTHIQHLHAETKVLPLANHLKLHASNFWQKKPTSNSSPSPS